MTVALEMVLPGIFGYWIDQRLGTKMVFLVAGMIFGVITGMIHLIQMTKEPQDNTPPNGARPDDSRRS